MMSEDDEYSFHVDIRPIRKFERTTKKPTPSLVPKKHIKIPKDRIVRAPSQISLQKYSLPRKKATKINKLTKGILFLPCSRYVTIQNAECNKKRLNILLRDKYKIASVDRRQRLRTDPIADDVKTIRQVDDNFFSIIEQPAPTYNLPFKSLVSLYNEYVQIRQDIGYRQDCVLKIEFDLKRDAYIYEKSFLRCVQQAKYFDQFISEDYEKSMAMLRAHDHLRHEIEIQDIESQILIDEKFSIIAKLILLEYKYRIQERYGRFLYYMSPTWWRAKHRDFAHSVEIQSKGFDLGKCEDLDTFSMILDNLVKECYSKNSKPAMFFKDAFELVNSIHRVQNQQVHHFTHILKMISSFTSEINDNINILKHLVRHETKKVAGEVKALQELVKACEGRGDELEARFFKVLNSAFYDAVASKDVLLISVHLEFAFERIVGSKPISLNISTMSKTIETIYLDYCYRIESFSNCDWMAEVAKGILEKQQKLKNARIAARELKSFTWLEKKLLTASLPGDTTSKWIHSRKSKNIAKGFTYSVPTEAEHEYLVNFTDWTPGTDPSSYLEYLKETEET